MEKVSFSGDDLKVLAFFLGYQYGPSENASYLRLFLPASSFMVFDDDKGERYEPNRSNNTIVASDVTSILQIYKLMNPSSNVPIKEVLEKFIDPNDLSFVLNTWQFEIDLLTQFAAILLVDNDINVFLRKLIKYASSFKGNMPTKKATFKNLFSRIFQERPGFVSFPPSEDIKVWLDQGFTYKDKDFYYWILYAFFLFFSNYNSTFDVYQNIIFNGIPSQFPKEWQDLFLSMTLGWYGIYHGLKKDETKNNIPGIPVSFYRTVESDRRREFLEAFHYVRNPDARAISNL